MIKTTFKQLASWVNGTLINTVDDLEVTKVSINTREMDGAQLFIPIQGEQFDGHNFVDLAFSKGALISLFSKELDYSTFKSPLIIVNDTTEALGLLAKNYLAHIGCKVVAITGSNGKTSTKDIISTLLETTYHVVKTQGNFNNEIGLPLTILGMPEDTEVAVLEMGMSSLGEIDRLNEIAPSDVSIITSIGKAHLIDLKTEENIVKAKLEITNHLKEDGILIYNGDHKLLKEQVSILNIPQEKVSYGHNPTNDFVISNVNQFIDSIVFYVERLFDQPIEASLIGQFQAQNVTAAILTALRFNVEKDVILHQLKHLQLTQKRNELLMINKAVVIDDSYKSNPESLEASLQLLNDYQNDGLKIAILGDMLDLGDDEVNYHKQIGQFLATLKIDRVYTYGDLSRYYHEGHLIIGEHFDNKENLIRSLKPWIQQSTTMLFKASNSLRLWEVIDGLKKEIKKMKVAVIFGGKSSEYSVSLSSAYSVLQNFPKEEYELIQIVISKDGFWYRGDFKPEEIENDTWINNPTLREVMVRPGTESKFFYVDNGQPFKVDVVFNMIHGKYGEDGVLQAILKQGGIAYTGCDQESSILCYDKDLTHRLLDLEKITKAKYRTLKQLISESDYEELVRYLGQKMIIKPAREGSSYGISVVQDYNEFYEGLRDALKFDNKVVIEEFIEGVELGCAVLEDKNELLVGEVDEIELHTTFFDFEAKYAFKDAQIHCPARVPLDIQEQTKKIAKKIFRLLDCKGFARVDFFYGNNGNLYFNEINTIPGFTSHSRFPSMMKAVGISYKDIIVTLIENALNQHER